MNTSATQNYVGRDENWKQDSLPASKNVPCQCYSPVCRECRTTCPILTLLYSYCYKISLLPYTRIFFFPYTNFYRYHNNYWEVFDHKNNVVNVVTALVGSIIIKLTSESFFFFSAENINKKLIVTKLGNFTQYLCVVLFMLTVQCYWLSSILRSKSIVRLCCLLW